MKRIYFISSAFIIISIILSIITGSFIPLIVGVIIATLFILGIIAYVNDWHKKYTDWFNRFTNNPNSALVIECVGFSILMILLIILILMFRGCGESVEKNNITTDETTATSVETTTKETTSIKETTTDETSSTEETTTVATQKTSEYTSNNNYTKVEPKEETTCSNFKELESSKREELYIPENGENIKNETAETTIYNGSVYPTFVEQETTRKIVELPTKPRETTREENAIIIPSNPFEEETTKKQSTTAYNTVSNVNNETTKYIKEETTTIATTSSYTVINTDITVSYTKGANVANVLVSFDKSADVKFIVSWYDQVTNNYSVVKNNNTSYSIKVDVPDNFKSKLCIRVLDKNGNDLKQIVKIINNQ